MGPTGGRGWARRPKWTLQVPHPAPPRLASSAGPGALEETTEVVSSGLPCAPEDRPGVRAALRPASLPPRPLGPALPRPTLRGLHPSAVFPIKAGIPGWAQTKRDRGKSTPRANQTLA